MKRESLERAVRNRPWLPVMAAVVALPPLVGIVWLVLPPPPGLTLNIGGDPRLIAFSPDGNVLAVRSHREDDEDDLLQIWDVVTGQLILIDSGYDVQFSPDSRLLVTPGLGGLLVRPFRTGTKLTTLIPFGRSSEITAWQFSPDTRFILLISRDPNRTQDDRLRLWDVSTQAIRGEIPGAFTDWRFASDGKTLATLHWLQGPVPGRVTLWNLEEGPAFLTPLKEYDVPGSRLAWSPDLTKMAVAAGGHREEPGTLELWDTATGEVLSRLTFQQKSALRELSFSNDGRRLVSRWACRDGPCGGGPPNILGLLTDLYVWECRPGLVELSAGDGEEVYWGLQDTLSPVIISPDGTRRAVFSERENAVIVSSLLDTGAEFSLAHAGDLKPGREHQFRDLPYLYFSPDSRRLLVTGLRRPRDGVTKDPIAPFLGLPELEKRYLRVARLWSVETGQELAAFPDCRQALFSRDGQRLAVVQGDDQVLIWDGRPQQTWANVLSIAMPCWLLVLLTALLVRRRVMRKRPKKESGGIDPSVS